MTPGSQLWYRISSSDDEFRRALTDETDQSDGARSEPREPRNRESSARGSGVSKLDGINKDPRTTFIINLVFVLTLLIGIPGGIVAAVALRAGSDTSQLQSPVGTPSVIVAPTPSHHQSGTSSAQAARDNVICKTTEVVEVPCGDPHRIEVVALDRMPGEVCDDRAVMTYLGGLAGLDVLTSEVGVDAAGDCAIEAPASQAEAFKDVLRSPRQAAWRSCRNDERRTDVACSEPHTGEYVGASSAGDATTGECASAVSDYVGTSFSLVDDRVTWRQIVGASDKPTGARCVIVARGDGLGIPIVLRNVTDLQFELVPLR